MIRSLDRKNNHDPNQEDPRTSTILSRILYLPDDMAWKILSSSILDYYDDLNYDVGAIESYDFWPKWSAEGTSNSNDVEPDVFIRFHKLDVIIEAKCTDFSGQDSNIQWRNEVKAYINMYGTSKKSTLLALGGNGSDTRCKEISVESDYTVHCYRVSWRKLRETVEALRLIPRDRMVHAVLDDICLACALFGFNTYKWFDKISWGNYMGKTDFSYENLRIL